jgi:sulfate transport system ATP-binding protein
MSLIVAGLTKHFGALPALHDVGLDVPQGGFLALIGPSGSGKTTLLRILGGLERADSGSVTHEGQDWLSVPPRERRVGFVFQHYALFKHMTVAKNVAFGLKVRPRRKRPGSSDIKRRVEELLNLVQLEGLGPRYPAQLSGGQRQRVALARALAIEPKLLLLDEPFGALDAKVRKELRRWLRELHDRLGLTTIFVTHDQEEALDLADHVAIMNGGKIEQMGTPEEVYAAPQTPFVAEFLGASNRFVGEMVQGRFVVDGVALPVNGAGLPDGPATALVRPQECAIAQAGETGIPARVTDVLAAGIIVRVECRRHNGEPLEVSLPAGAEAPPPGSEIQVMLLTPRLYRSV